MRKKPEGKYFPVRIEQKRLTRNLLFGSGLVFFPILTGFK